MNFCLASFLCVASSSATNDFDTVNLLQTTKHFAGVPKHVGEVQKHKHEFGDVPLASSSLASMSDAVSMLERHRTNGGGWGDTEKATLNTFKNTLINSFKPLLDQEHNDDQNEFNVRKAMHNACITHTDAMFGLSGDVTAAQAAATEAKAKHAGCRKSEKSWNNYRTLSLATASCPGAPDLSTVHEIFQAHENVFAAMTLAKTQATEYSSLAPVGQKRACDLDQTDYEDKYCLWRGSRYYACSGLEGCITQVGLANLKSSLAIRANNRRAFLQTVDKLLCRVDYLLGTFDLDSGKNVSDVNTTDTCDNVPLNVASYVLDMPIPSHTGCSGGNDVSPLPGGTTCTAWISQEYDWPITTHVIPGNCQSTCPTITPNPFTPPAECAGEPAQCAFYNAHQNLCGLYDSDTFVANTTCCACGAGSGPALTPATQIRLVSVGGTNAGKALRWANECATPDTNDDRQVWRLPLCNNAACQTDAAGLGSSYWSDGDDSITSGAVVDWFSVSAGRVADCAGGGCSSQPHPPPGGHWGTPYRIFKLDTNGNKVTEGTNINVGDTVIFERMYSGSWSTHYLLGNGGSCATPGSTTTLAAVNWQDWAFYINAS